MPSSNPPLPLPLPSPQLHGTHAATHASPSPDPLPDPAPDSTQAPPHPTSYAPAPPSPSSVSHPRFESPRQPPLSPSGSLITRAFFGRSCRRRPPHSSLTRASSIATFASRPPTRSSPSSLIHRHRSGTVATSGSIPGGPASSSSHRWFPQSRRAELHQIPSSSNPRLLFASPSPPPPRPRNPSQQGTLDSSVIIPATSALEDQLGPLPSILPAHHQPISLSQNMDPLTITRINPEEDDDDGQSDEEAIVTDEEVDLLEVVDPAVHTASTLGHIQNSLLLPVSFSPFSSPVVESPDPATSSPRIKPRSPRAETERRSRFRRRSILFETGIQHHPQQRQQLQDQEVEEVPVPVQDDHPIDYHIMEMVEQQGQNQKLKRMVKGAWAFLKTPLGILFGIYGFLVVFWGAALVLILLKWIKIEPIQQYRIWVEICSQILNGLFTIPGIGLLPCRLIDWWNIFVTIHYARIIWSRKGKKNLADPNELLPLDLERANAEKLAATAVPSSTHEAPKKRRRHEPCQKFEDERRILSEYEIIKLERAQTKLCKSQTWYRPHSSPTHYAFPIWGAFFILACNLGNSLFQAALCGVMWGLRYSRRPAWTTATFMAASFSCGISSAILIWLVGRKTQKSKEVMERVEEILKNGNCRTGTGTGNNNVLNNSSRYQQQPPEKRSSTPVGLGLLQREQPQQRHQLQQEEQLKQEQDQEQVEEEQKKSGGL